MNRLALSAVLLTALAPALAQSSGTTSAPPTVTSRSASKTVQVAFVAGHAGHNGGLNYNGDAKGEKTLTVPLGWTVEVSLSNAGKMPHDFAVVAGTAVPTDFSKVRLAFPNAATSVIAPGGAAAATRFVANRPGTYLILCRVGRHAQNGMYVKMTVSNSVKAPTYR
ncbi:multicopper oxidase domain-containing protein [Deinococcus sp. SDU3-2]|uniref:Multicopper oxidase domain-containing protein n=1 Tax=Deinococcus terrestris TaxID=2651870 RepID=A0A7X1NXA2_9DEIO|nr:sulfocyanin-like copper-binding protein [Deinococcus terrestris]MPY67071.1 multicopper oxidase domain-containing protein [Deinococcus terrestris]